MALNDITLNDGQATPVSHTFTFVTQNGSRVIRKDLSAALEQPIHLTMAHSSRKVAGKDLNSHLFRVDITLLDADGVTPYMANVRLAADVPSPIFSVGLASDLAAYIRNWATAANVTAWLKGSVG